MNEKSTLFSSTTQILFWSLLIFAEGLWLLMNVDEKPYLLYNVNITRIGIWSGLFGLTASALSSYTLNLTTKHSTAFFMILLTISILCDIVMLVLAVFKGAASLNFERGELCLCCLCITKLCISATQIIMCLLLTSSTVLLTLLFS